jgi:hypothetical protein
MTATGLHIEYAGRLALTITQAAERYGLERDAARKAIMRLEEEGKVKRLEPDPIDARTPLYDAEELDGAMGSRPGRGANLRGPRRPKKKSR